MNLEFSPRQLRSGINTNERPLNDASNNDTSDPDKATKLRIVSDPTNVESCIVK